MSANDGDDDQDAPVTITHQTYALSKPSIAHRETFNPTQAIIFTEMLRVLK